MNRYETMNKLFKTTIKNLAGWAIALSLPLGIAPGISEEQFGGTNQCAIRMHSLQNSLRSYTESPAPLNLLSLENVYPNIDFPSGAMLLAVFTVDGDSIGSDLEAIIDDFLDTCVGIHAVEFRGNRSGFQAIYGWVDGEKRWFECVEAGLNRSPLKWGQQICGL